MLWIPKDRRRWCPLAAEGHRVQLTGQPASAVEALRNALTGAHKARNH